MGADEFSAQLAKAAALNQQIGRSKALLELQDWVSNNRDALKGACLYESLMQVIAK